MLKIFTGDDRVRALAAIAKFLGPDYEVIEGLDITPADMPSIFLGNSLFATTRQILIRDLAASPAAFAELPNYLHTPHSVALLESKLDKRSSTYKTCQAQSLIQEFALPPDPNQRRVFDIYKLAKRDGSAAVKLLQQIELQQDPMMFFGLLVSQALQDYRIKQGIKERAILQALSRLDLSLKSSVTSPWLLIEAFLLQLNQLS